MKKVLQWHPAFQAVLQIEFSGEAQYLQFFKEYNLTDSPLRIDTLVIKKDQGVQIRKKSAAYSADIILWSTRGRMTVFPSTHFLKPTDMPQFSSPAPSGNRKSLRMKSQSP